jgi:hypothetical protein
MIPNQVKNQIRDLARLKLVKSQPELNPTNKKPERFFKFWSSQIPTNIFSKLYAGHKRSDFVFKIWPATAAPKILVRKIF